MNEVKKIGETIEVIFKNRPDQVCEITGRNWAFERFISYIVDLDGMSITVNQDGTCQWNI